MNIPDSLVFKTPPWSNFPKYMILPQHLLHNKITTHLLAVYSKVKYGTNSKPVIIASRPLHERMADLIG